MTTSVSIPGVTLVGLSIKMNQEKPFCLSRIIHPNGRVEMMEGRPSDATCPTILILTAIHEILSRITGRVRFVSTDPDLHRMYALPNLQLTGQLAAFIMTTVNMIKQERVELTKVYPACIK